MIKEYKTVSDIIQHPEWKSLLSKQLDWVGLDPRCVRCYRDKTNYIDSLTEKEMLYFTIAYVINTYVTRRYLSEVPLCNRYLVSSCAKCPIRYDHIVCDTLCSVVNRLEYATMDPMLRKETIDLVNALIEIAER